MGGREGAAVEGAASEPFENQLEGGGVGEAELLASLVAYWLGSVQSDGLCQRAWFSGQRSETPKNDRFSSEGGGRGQGDRPLLAYHGRVCDAVSGGRG